MPGDLWPDFSLYPLVRKTRHELDPNTVLRGGMAGNGDGEKEGAAREKCRELFQNCTYPCNKLFLKNRKIMALLKFLLSGNENKKKGR